MLGNFRIIESVQDDGAYHTDMAGCQTCIFNNPVQ